MFGLKQNPVFYLKRQDKNSNLREQILKIKIQMTNTSEILGKDF